MATAKAVLADTAHYVLTTQGMAGQKDAQPAAEVMSVEPSLNAVDDATGALDRERLRIRQESQSYKRDDAAAFCRVP
jgi:hypothetical protein